MLIDRVKSPPATWRSAPSGRRCDPPGCSRWRRARPSPTAPRPSSVGTPSAAVKLPSEPPPVSDSSNLHAQFARQLLRRAGTGARCPAERSIGGRFNPPVTSIVQRLSNGLRARNFRSSTGASFSRSTRISTSAVASAATTFDARAARDHARIDRDAARQIGESGDRARSAAPVPEWRSRRPRNRRPHATPCRAPRP